ncbi:unnamed protein product [Protopolystoma xenopodis]|uniref:Uncharacterized protein n=1 Tax=Protopolystoma xenopodis TaxID=117903 RepID=A0A448X0N2_9PLAT|nr:unnamed protein product [Protopolystoma xenopodis]
MSSSEVHGPTQTGQMKTVVPVAELLNMTTKCPISDTFKSVLGSNDASTAGSVKQTDALWRFVMTPSNGPMQS